MKRSTLASRISAAILAVLITIFNLTINLYFKPPIFLAMVLYVVAFILIVFVVVFITRTFFLKV